MRQDYSRITDYLRRHGKTVTTMESCTGGFLASLLTDTEGASSTISAAYVTYSNEAKIACGVPQQVIEQYGVYSAETAAAMAQAAAQRAGADYAVAVTGTLGRVDPANADSVSGQVWCAVWDGAAAHTLFLPDVSRETRQAAKAAVADAVADLLWQVLPK